MQVLRYETPKEVLHIQSDTPKVFLAGPTVRSTQSHLTSWRIEAVEIYERLGFDGALIIPEFTDRAASNLSKDWIVEWEFAGLRAADCILFWIPRTQELIGLTTNYELGYWLGRERDKVVYGRPDDAYRITYPDAMWKLDAEEKHYRKYSTEIYNTLESTIQASITSAQKIHERRNTERILNNCL